MTWHDTLHEYGAIPDAPDRADGWTSPDVLAEALGLRSSKMVARVASAYADQKTAGFPILRRETDNATHGAYRYRWDDDAIWSGEAVRVLARRLGWTVSRLGRKAGLDWLVQLPKDKWLARPHHDALDAVADAHAKEVARYWLVCDHIRTDEVERHYVQSVEFSPDDAEKAWDKEPKTCPVSLLQGEGGDVPQPRDSIRAGKLELVKSTLK